MNRQRIWLGLAVVVVALVVVTVAAGQTRDAGATASCDSGTAVSNPADNPGLVGDCAVLLAVKDTLRGTATLNWSADTAISSWTGVTVRGEPQRVTELQLQNSSLNGTIPARLAELQKLEWLYLYGNALTGAIPAELGSLEDMEHLYLHSNQLTGTIPRALGSLSNLSTLGLNNNRLTGSIPGEFGDLWSLRDLYLENNQLSGAIPEVLVDLGLRSLYLAGNSGLTGCVPAGLTSVSSTDVTTLGLTTCAARPTFTLTTSKTGAGNITPAAGVYTYGRTARVRVTATPGSRSSIRVASWGGDCAATPVTETACILTMDANKTASVTFERITYTLTAEAVGEGSVDPSGTTTQFEGATISVTATWDESTHVFDGWSGDCQGLTATCRVIMDANRTATATFAERCTAGAMDPTCVRVVYAGAPADYANVSDVPDDRILERNSAGSYYVERGQQYTVITGGASVPEGYTRFYLQRQPVTTSSVPLSSERLVSPPGTTYTFTVASDVVGGEAFAFDLTAGNHNPQGADQDPILGDVIVTTTFEVIPAPDLIVVSDETASSLLLEWTGGPSDATSWRYRLTHWNQTEYRQEPWGQWTDIPSSGAATRSHRLTGLASPRGYFVELRAIVGTVRGTASNTSTGITHAQGSIPYISPGQVVEGDGSTQWRLHGLRYVVTIPDGMRLRTSAGAIGADGHRRFTLFDVESGEAIGFDADTGREVGRTTVAPATPEGGQDGARQEHGGTPQPGVTRSAERNVHALFSQLVSSVREVPVQ